MKTLTKGLAAAMMALLPYFALAATYPMPKAGNDIIGEIYTVKAQPGDTLDKLGLRYGMSAHEMMEANPGLNFNSKLRGGQKLVVPAQFILPPFRKGIVINMAELRLYYFTSDGKYVMTFPVAMGRDQWRSPVTSTTVVWKETEPVWHVPESIRNYKFETTGEVLPDEIPPGPDNPLGHYALHLGKAGYLIHGNNSPSSIGKFVSSGCVRMRNADIETLFNVVAVGTPVRITHYPNKVGWFNGQLYLESQVPVAIQDDASDLNITSVEDAINMGLKNRTAVIDWKAAEKIAKKHSGIPELIGQTNSQAENENYESHPPLQVQYVNDTGNNNAMDSQTLSVEDTDTNINLESVNLDSEDSTSSWEN